MANDGDMLLTAEQIEEIGHVLHENVQFYDSSGAKANDSVIDAITEALTTHCCIEEQSDGGK